MGVILTKTGQSEITQPNVGAEMYIDCKLMESSLSEEKTKRHTHSCERNPIVGFTR